MSSDVAPPIAIRVEGLGKRYKLGQRQPYRRLGESITRIITTPFRGRQSAKRRDVLWALRDVSFDVHAGEIVGVIGPNGAGKTTLLRILARITRPTEGRAEIYGRVGSLLEVGTGFHPELTGRENVYLNGAILGMTRKEINKKYDEIVEFAQIEEFMQTPVKYYSSGMRVRLAFSVAAHLDPEILFIDEVLSVGDAAFQARCLKKMEEVAGGGRTVLFVSHSMGAVTSLCTRCIWVEGGGTKMDGDPRDVVEAYLTRGLTSGAVWNHPDDASCGQEVRIATVEVLGQSGEPETHIPFDQPVRVRWLLKVQRAVEGLTLAFRVVDATGTVIMTSSNLDMASEVNWEPGQYSLTTEIPGSLLRPGHYTLNVLARRRTMRFDEHESILRFDILPMGFTRQRAGVIMPMLPWVMEDASVDAGAS